MASDQSWKEKYLQELEATEYQKKQWESERNSLERMLVRTSLASEGQTPELDQLLARVRKDLRKKKVDVEAWRKLQDQIDRQVALLDEQHVKTGVSETAGSTPEAARPTPETETAESEAAAIDGDHDLKDHQQRLRIARRVGQLLGQMLNQVQLKPDAEARARRLQQSLLSSEDWQELREGLGYVAELVIVAVTRTQREFEEFLKHLDERLGALRQHVAEQSSAQSSRVDASETLDQQIRKELEQVGLDLQSSDDLHSLKKSVSQHLQSIGEAVVQFRTGESERERLLSEQLATMQDKVAAMEAHSEQMQDQVRRERQRAMTDLLTQLPNREAWQERLAFEFNRWQRYQNPVTVGVVDIDLFKRVNDSFGHKAGDRVLQIVARELGKGLRNTDFIARFGGEEFVLLFPETDMAQAEAVLNKLRERIGTLPFHFDGQPVTITFSAGISEAAPGDAEDALFERADQALYQAKAAGRNCIVKSDSQSG